MLWYESVGKKFGLSLITSTFLIGYLPWAILYVPTGLAASQFGVVPAGSLGPSALISGFILNSLVLFPSVVFLMLAARHLRMRIQNLQDYASSISAEGSHSEMKALTELRGPLVLWIPLEVSYTAAYWDATTSYLANILTQFSFFYIQFLTATLVWVVLYSSYRIYKLGKGRLKLRPFTEDSTLGLGHFGSTALRVTVIYLAYLILFVTPIFLTASYLSLVSGVVPLLILAVLYLVTFVIFLLPLVSLRKKLVAAKREELGWITPRLTQIMTAFKEGSAPSASLQAELATVDKLLQEARRIQTWPFDTGAFARLAAVTLSVSAILVATIIRDVLRF